MSGSRQRTGQAAVACGHRASAAVAVEILRAGGNAFDAAIGAGMASCVSEPMLTSLGGGGFLLAHTASAQNILFDFFCDTPGLGLDQPPDAIDFKPVTVPFGGADQVFHVGMGSSAVPGVLAGYAHAHARLGRLPLDRVVAPAARLAREGVALNASQAYVNEILGPICTATEGSRAIFAPHGELLGEGELIRSEELAAFLEAFALGRATLYSGEFADRIDADMRATGGLLTREDLGAYRVIEREPLALDYHGRTVLTNPAPSLGGPLIGLALRLLREAMSRGVAFESPHALLELVGVAREVEQLRGHDEAINDDLVRRGVASVRTFVGGTTHVSVIDGEGNAASMTTSNGQGCGYVVPGTGVMLNNMMGEDDLFPGGFHSEPPGRRIRSMMSPTIVLEDGRPALVLGSGGSKRIRTAITRVLSAVLDAGLDVQEAIDAPRAHWDGEIAQLEPGFTGEAVAALGERVPVNVWEASNVYFGGVHAVARDHDGLVTAGGDQRRDGWGEVVENTPTG
ncbi:MAG: gamma-glutamyltransferase [Phycisphaerales bacterium]